MTSIADVTSDELLVAEILIDFPKLSKRSEFSLGLTPSWSHHRKRSALESPPPPPPPPPSSSATSAAVSPTTSKKVKVLSPDSPLVLNTLPPLSRSESDDNPVAKRSSSYKKPSLDKKSQYVEVIDDLTKQNQGLKGELESLKQHYNNLKSTNHGLKSLKQEVIHGYKNEIATSCSSMVNFPGESSNRNQFQPGMVMSYQMGEQSNVNSHNFQSPIFYDPSIGPKGIPDLNIAYEEPNQRDYARFLAAQARKNRIQICKNKNNGAPK